MTTAFDYWYLTAAVLGPATAYAAYVDWRQHRVPNWLTASIATAGLAAQVLCGQGLLQGLGGLLVGFGVLIVPWAMHGMGAGDVKLMAAIGAWFGPWMTVISFCAGAVLGGVVAVVMIVWAGKTRDAAANLATISYKITHRDVMFTDFGSAKGFGSTSQLLPYGVPLTIGSFAILAIQMTSGWPAGLAA
jgi:prepilin peptidase CpaA